MCIAEALLRIPDSDTADELIAEKIAGGHWERHLGHSDSLFVNASTWALLLTGRVVKLKVSARRQPARRHQAARRALGRARHPPGRAPGGEGPGRPVRARAHHPARRSRAPKSYEDKGYLFSYDMLGEAARTQKDADALLRALHGGDRCRRPGRGSVRHHALDALYRRPGHVGEAVGAASALRARQGGAPRRGAGAEAPQPGARRALARAVDHDRRGGAGPARADARAFRRRSSPIRRSTAGTGLGSPCRPTASAPFPVLRWLRRLSERTGKRIPVRLVKGAYWDSEIKWAQERALADYPVFTRKLNTDVSYLACVRLLLERSQGLLSADSRPTTRTRSPPRTSPAAPPCSSSSACTAWARRSTRR